MWLGQMTGAGKDSELTYGRYCSRRCSFTHLGLGETILTLKTDAARRTHGRSEMGARVVPVGVLTAKDGQSGGCECLMC